MAFLDRFVLPIRVIQLIFAIAILGFTAYAADKWDDWWDSPSEVNFLVFTSVWTLLAVIYLWLAPIKFPAAAHKFAILGVESVTMIFWFAGFIALAAFLDDINCRWSRVCRVSIAATVFAAFQWVLFTITTVWAALHVWRTRGTHSTEPAPAVQQAPYTGA
ncbi:membrane-associating domain-containing protein [Bisporella sp. PMI_857]|nr:membrane-associating domain-containing protein [Bisporella sp. PMI_857]